MHILLIASRDLTGPLTGRKQVLWTALESLHRLGHELSVAMFTSAREIDTTFRGLPMRSWHLLRRPSYAELLANVAWRAPKGGMSLNEALFYSPRICRQLEQIADEQQIDFVVCDMIRTAPYAARLGLPWHLDLDDLLSQRYHNLARQSGRKEQVAGYYSGMLPGWLAPVISSASRLVLPLEARRIARREQHWSQQASSVSLVSALEAERLSERIGRQVFGLPMRATFPPADYVVSSQRSGDVVFLGGLDYQPNLDALRYYRDSILPELKLLGRESVACHVLGKATDQARRELPESNFRFHGYVDRLADELGRHSAFIAPITHGTGIKTKVLDAMAHGLPVIATPLGIEGIGAIDGEHCLVGDSPHEFAQRLHKLLSNPSRGEQIGMAAAQYVRENFSLDVIAARWEQVLASALPQPSTEQPAADEVAAAVAG
jgi:glycosyltransferase involved in cell wall biosynthesis